MDSVIKDIYYREYSNDWSSIKVFATYGHLCKQPDNVRAYNFIDKYRAFEVEDG